MNITFLILTIIGCIDVINAIPGTVGFFHALITDDVSNLPVPYDINKVIDSFGYMKYALYPTFIAGTILFILPTVLVTWLFIGIIYLFFFVIPYAVTHVSRISKRRG